MINNPISGDIKMAGENEENITEAIVAEITTTNKSTVGKVTMITTAIGGILTVVIGTHQIGSWGLDKIDERTERMIVTSKAVESHVSTLISNNAYDAVKESLDRRGMAADIRSLKLELRIIKGAIRDYNGIENERTLTPEEREELNELKYDRDIIKQEIKDLTNALNGFS